MSFKLRALVVGLYVSIMTIGSPWTYDAGLAGGQTTVQGSGRPGTPARDCEVKAMIAVVGTMKAASHLSFCGI